MEEKTKARILEGQPKVRILVVEDDPEAAAMAKSLLLKKFAADVEIAPDITTARFKLAGDHFNIVLLDYQLPDGNGIEMLQEITSREDHPAVIMVTGQGDEEIAALAFRYRAAGYVVKDRRLPTLLPEIVGGAMSEIALKQAQEALRLSEEVERALLNATTDAVFMANAAGTIIVLNQRAADIFGVDLEEATGANVFEFLPPDVIKRWRAPFADIFTEGEALRFEEQLEDSWYDNSLFPLFDEHGAVERLAVYSRDITERKQAEEELRKARDELERRVEERTAELRAANEDLQQEIAERLKAEQSLKSLTDQVQRQAEMLDEILSTSPDQFYILDGKGKFVYASSGGAEALGLKDQKMSGKYWWELGMDEQAMRIVDQLREQVFETGEARRGEVRMPTRRGTRDFEFVMNPVHRANGKGISTVVATARDVTEQKRARELLERRAQEMTERAELLDLVPRPIILRQSDGTIGLWNKSAEELYGYTKEEAVGRVAHELLETEFPEPLDEIADDLEHEGFWSGQLVHTARNGRKIKVDSTWSARRDPSGEVSAIVELFSPVEQ